MGDDAATTGHDGDAGTDEPDVGQTSTEDLPVTGEESGADAENTSETRDDDIAAGHLGEPGGPAWARGKSGG